MQQLALEYLEFADAIVNTRGLKESDLLDDFLGACQKVVALKVNRFRPHPFNASSQAIYEATQELQQAAIRLIDAYPAAKEVAVITTARESPEHSRIADFIHGMATYKL